MPRSGRPPVYTAQQRALITVMVCATLHEHDLPLSRFSVADLLRVVRQEDSLANLSHSTLARPLQPTPLAAVLEGYGDFSALPIWEQILQPLFYACFVARSVDLRLIDLENLHVAGDGSKLPTWANPRGRKLCDCDNRDKKAEDRCRCHRAYHDPLALWGWDSYRQCWVYPAPFLFSRFFPPFPPFEGESGRFIQYLYLLMEYLTTLKLNAHKGGFKNF